MSTTTNKGQVVQPKAMRDTLRLRSPTWRPLNPAGVSLSTSELCNPVDLGRKRRAWRHGIAVTRL